VLLSLRFPRTFVNAGCIFFLIAGSLLLAIGTHFDNALISQIGYIMTVMLHYSVALTLMMIILEYYPCSSFCSVLVIALSSQTAGRLASVWAYSNNLTDDDRALMIVMPSCAFYVISALVITESPRYLIDNNILKLEQLLVSISEVNDLKT
jgi:hypothetical protein